MGANSEVSEVEVCIVLRGMAEGTAVRVECEGFWRKFVYSADKLVD